ncbi:MAG: Sec-independent protein translocase protein TatB [Alcanivorax sp.]
MFDIGFSELTLIFVIGLVVLGPERLPKAARTVGYWMGRARSTFNHLRNELEREALNQDMRERMESQMREMGLDEDSIREARDNLLSEQEVARARRRPQTLEHEPLEHDTGDAPSPAAEHPESEKKSND